jgi:hypothetical protein
MNSTQKKSFLGPMEIKIRKRVRSTLKLSPKIKYRESGKGVLWAEGWKRPVK